MLLGITPNAIYQHTWTRFLLKVEPNQEIIKAKELLKVDYDLDRIVQHYCKVINEARLLLTALRETVTNDKVIQNAYATLKKNIDLKDAYACREWNGGILTSWADMRKHFSKEIQMNKTHPAIMKRVELANTVLAQSKEDEFQQPTPLKIV